MSETLVSRKVQRKATRNPFGPDRVTIGLLVDWVVGHYQEPLVLSMLDAARKRNANLICFAGESLAGPGERKLRNAAFRLASSDSVDALIVATAGLGNAAGPAGVAQFCERFGDIPMVSVSAEMKDVPSIVVDNDAGTRELLMHLVRDHGYRRIAYIRGATNNVETESRFHTYLDVLRTNGLEIHENLIVEPDPNGPQTHAVEELVDRRHVRLDTLDAIAVCDDATASAVLRELERRGVRVPEQMVVTGFDDNEQASYENPPLTTVRQPLDELGTRAVQLAMDLLNGIAVPLSTVLPTRLVVRASCRCFGRGTRVPEVRSAPTRQLPDFEAALIERRDLILAEVARSARGGLRAAGAGWEGRLFSGLLVSLRTDRGDEFLKVFDEVLRATVAASGDLRMLHDALLALRSQAMATLNAAPAQRDRAELLFHEATAIICDALESVQAKRRILLKVRTEAIAGVVTAFNEWKTSEEFRRRLAQHLETLGIATCYVATYEQAQDETRAKLVFSYRGYRRHPKEEVSAAFPSSRLLPDAIANEDRSVVQDDRPLGLVLAPLFFEGESLGYMLIELGQCEASAFYVLPALVSLALHHARAAGE
jgi:DNA-binding LacI/PurR family transcriptional regulator